MSGDKNDYFAVGQRDQHGRQICGGRNKACRRCKRRYSKKERSLTHCSKCGEDRRCSQTILAQNGRCRKHFGEARKGIAHPNYKHGLYSKAMPTRMLEDFEASQNDPDQISLSRSIALIDSLIVDTLKRMDSGEAGTLWRQAQDAMDAMEVARINQDAGAAQLALENLRRSIGRGVSDYAARGEYVRLIEQRRKLSDSQFKQDAKHDGRMLHVGVVAILFDRYSEIVRRTVSDRSELATIARDAAVLFIEADTKQTLPGP